MGPPTKQELACFARVAAEIKAFQDGRAVLDGEIDLLWRPDVGGKSSPGSSKGAEDTIERLRQDFGADSACMQGSAVVFEINHTADSARESWPCGDGNEIFRGGAVVGAFGAKSLTYYPALGCVHLQIFFDGASFAQECSASGLSPLNRRCVRLELVRNPAFPPVRFLADPGLVTANAWEELLPRVAARLVAPPAFVLAPEVSLMWELGPNPSIVHGVDFSGLFSKEPLTLVLLQMRAWQVQVKLLLPGGVAGALAIVSFGMVRLPAMRTVLLVVALLVAFAAGLNLVGLAKSLVTRLTTLYTLGICLGVVALSAASFANMGSVEFRDDACASSMRTPAAVAGCWLGLHVALAWGWQRGLVRGSWEQCVANGKLGAIARPETPASELLSLPRRAQQLAQLEDSHTKVVPW